MDSNIGQVSGSNNIDQQKGNPGVLFLQIICVILAILLLICILCKFFCVSEAEDDAPSQEQFTTFPASELADDVVLPEDTEEARAVEEPEIPPTSVNIANGTPRQNTSDWRDDVVDHTYDDPVSVSDTSGEDYLRSLYVPPAANTTPPPVIKDPYVPPVIYPELQVKVFDSCGSVVIPDPNNAIENAMFVATFGRNPTAICMGTAIANDCDPSRAFYTQGSDSGYVYIAPRNDGVCGVGLSDDGATVELCSIEDLMNVSMKDSKSFAEWQVLYRADPGQTFVNAYLSGLTTSVVAFDSSTAHCQFFALE